MNKSFIKTLSLILAVGFLSLVGFNPAFGYGGGGGGLSSCVGVTYGEWGNCVNDMQYRDIVSQNPHFCNLTSSQQLERSRNCVFEEETVVEELVVETPVVETEVPVVEERVLGEAKYADGTLLRGSDNKVYVVVNGALKHIVSLEELIKYAGQEIVNVDDLVITSFGEGIVKGETKYADGTLLRDSSMKIYVIINGKKKHVLNLEELMKYAGQEIVNVEDGVISGMESA